MITSLDPTAITGVTPQGADRELYVSLSAAVRLALHGHGPIFPMPEVEPPGGGALTLYVALGIAMGVIANIGNG